ncbi:MAG: ArsR/SmtB family transcription factor [Acidimicrobiia bacterium]
MQVSNRLPDDRRGASVGAGRVAPTGPRLVESEEAFHLAELFRLLGDPTRVRILYTLLEADELCVHDIAERAGTGETKVSQAMRLLRAADVVRNRRDGRHIFYRLDDDHIRTLLEVSRTHLAHGAGAGEGSS